MREGLERIFVPVCKHPKDHMFTFGPLGYVEVDRVIECPILVESDKTKLYVGDKGLSLKGKSY